MKIRILSLLSLTAMLVGLTGCGRNMLSIMERDISKGGGTDYYRYLEDPGFADARDDPRFDELIELARPALENGDKVEIDIDIQNVNRTFGTLLSGRIAERYGFAGLPEGAVAGDPGIRPGDALRDAAVADAAALCEELGHQVTPAGPELDGRAFARDFFLAFCGAARLITSGLGLAFIFLRRAIDGIQCVGQLFQSLAAAGTVIEARHSGDKLLYGLGGNRRNR